MIIFLFIAIILIPKLAKTQEQSLWKDLGLYGGQITSLAIDPAAPQIMYAGSWGGDGVFKTTDGGATWHAIPKDNPSWFRNLEIYDIEIDPGDSRVIWVANNHYVDVSRDSGATWQTFYFAYDEDRFCYSVAVDPFDSNSIYVGTGGKNSTDEYGEIFISDDGGITWNDQGFQSKDIVWNNFWQLKFNPRVQGEVWAANRKSYLSADGMVLERNSKASDPGWYYWSTALYTVDHTNYYFGYIDEVLVHPVDPLKIFLSSGEGIIYKDSGDSRTQPWKWTTVFDGCRAMCIPPSEPSTLYAGLFDTIVILKDDGTTWKDSATLPAPSEFLTMEPHPSDPASIFAGSLNQGIQKTNDRAESWTTINSGIKSNTVFDTAVDPANSERIMAGTLAGIFLKENSIADWKQINKNSSETVAFDPVDTSTMYAGFDWSIGKSTDKGASWSYLKTNDQENSNKITSIAINANSASVYAAVSFSSGYKGQLLKIEHTRNPFAPDATASVIFETPVPLNAIAISPHDPSFMIAVSGSFYSPAAPGKMYISRNGGQTWHKKFLLGQYVLNCIAFDPSNPQIIYAGSGSSDGYYGAILKSTNGGLTWRRTKGGLPPNFAVKDIKVTSDGAKVYAVLYKGYSDTNNLDLGGTYVSLDGGKYWTRVGLSDYRMYDISLADAGTASHSQKSASAVQAKPAAPTYTVYAGSASGLMNEDPSTIAGTGIISGMVTTNAGLPLSNVSLTSSAGTGSQSEQGVYLMICPSGMHDIRATAAGYIQTGATMVQVQAGGSSQFNIMMEPFADNSTNCLSENILRDTPESRYLKPLRAFRDNVLKKTPFGKDIIAQYYQLGGEIVPILLGNVRLREKCKKLLGKSAEIILARAGKPLTLPPGFMDEASDFLFELEKNSPQQVRGKINKLRSDMRHFKPERIQVRQ